MILRPYQQEAVNAVYDYLRAKEGNPCVVLPTAAGKTPVLATICRDAVKYWNGRVLVLAHVKELLQQAADKLQAVCPDVSVGVYSAGLGSRDTQEPVIVAGIQSVYQKADVLGHFDLVLIDECHLLPEDGEGMYRTFLRGMKTINPNVRLIGLTATPYRLKSGLLCGPDNLLNEICYEIGVKELIVRGYLCPLKSKGSTLAVDTSNLHVRGGEFVSAEVEQLVGTEEFEQAACQEIVARTKDRNSILVFAASVERADAVCKLLKTYSGCECAVVTGETSPGTRDLLLRQFKRERIEANLLGEPLPPLKYLVNVNVLTTGFDAPNTDCVVLLRPTASPGLFYQMVGRGFRLHESKTDCLVLDYGNNITRHGPVDAVRIKPASGRNGEGEAPAKECPKCHQIVHAAVAVCNECGFEFPKRSSNHEREASNEGIVSGEATDTTYTVFGIDYSVHQKFGASPGDPRTLRIDYTTGSGYQDTKSEWICPEHDGWARKKFEGWWAKRTDTPPPDSADEAVDFARAGGLLPCTEIFVRKVAGEKFDRIIKHTLAAQLPPPTVDVSRCEDCIHSGYDNDFSIVCNNGWAVGGPCAHFEGPYSNDDNLDDVPF